MRKQSDNKEYSVELQKLFLQMMITNAELYTRVMNIMNSENFDKSLRSAAELFKEHTTKYGVLPDSTQIKALTGMDLEVIPELSQGHYDWFFEEFESFRSLMQLATSLVFQNFL